MPMVTNVKTPTSGINNEKRKFCGEEDQERECFSKKASFVTKKNPLSYFFFTPLSFYHACKVMKD